MIRLLTRRGVQMALLMALLLMATWFSGSQQPWLQRLQYATFDTFNRIYPRPSTDSVVIIDIDEESLAVLGQWPWPHDILAQLPLKLKEMGAASIAFDMVFAEPDRTSPPLLAKRLKDPSAEAARNVLSSMPDNDEIFAKAIAQTGNVVMGFVGTESGNEGKVPSTIRGMVISPKARDILIKNAYFSSGVATSLPILEKAAAGNGSFSVNTNLDGIVRTVPLIVRAEDKDGNMQLYPSLALEALRVAAGKASIIVSETKARNKSGLEGFESAINVKVGNIILPADSEGRMWVYYTPRKMGRYISAWKVMAGQIDPSIIKGRFAFIGTSAEGLKDIRSSPLDLFIPGVEMHVNVVEQALQGKYTVRPAYAMGIEACFIFITGLAIIFLAPFINLVLLLVVVMLLIVSAVTISAYSYEHFGLLIDPVYPSLAVMVMFVLSSLLSYLKAEYERREIRGAFGLYISPDFMTELTKNPDKLQLGGEIKNLTIMFTDIRNFTTISEAMTPQVLINTMNDFLTPMSDEVMKTRGTIDKYMGDAMMAFWNAPLDVDNHEREALRAALAMRGVLAPINEQMKILAEKENRPFYPLNCGIGINTGPCAVGNMGSKQRFAYSVLGDACNLASRLEGQTKTYGVNILLGEATAKNVADFALMEVDYIQVKGKTEPVRIYTALGDENMGQGLDFHQWQATHDAFLHAYRNAEFDDALGHIKSCRAMDREDRLGDYYMVMEMRIKDFQKNTPPQNWDGVYAATGK
ncbi:MAG TPA: adenylate/guanylate cyclase domain-containing protein [Alphaproteobacteria bacterium]